MFEQTHNELIKKFIVGFEALVCDSFIKSVQRLVGKNSI